MENDKQIVPRPSSLKKEVKLFLQNVLSLLKSSHPNVYNLKEEYAKTAKNRSWFVMLLIVGVGVVTGIGLFISHRIISTQMRDVSIGIETADDLNLQNLLDMASEVEKSYNETLHELSTLEGEQRAALDANTFEANADKLNVYMLSLPPAEQAQKLAEIDAAFREKEEAITATYAEPIRALNEKLDGYRAQMATFDKARVAEAQERQRAINAEVLRSEAEKEQLRTEYESIIANLQGQLEGDSKLDPEEVNEIDEIIAAYRAEIATLDPRFSDREGLTILREIGDLINTLFPGTLSPQKRPTYTRPERKPAADAWIPASLRETPVEPAADTPAAQTQAETDSVPSTPEFPAATASEALTEAAALPPSAPEPPAAETAVLPPSTQELPTTEAIEKTAVPEPQQADAGTTILASINRQTPGIRYPLPSTDQPLLAELGLDSTIFQRINREYQKIDHLSSILLSIPWENSAPSYIQALRALSYKAIQDLGNEMLDFIALAAALKGQYDTGVIPLAQDSQPNEERIAALVLRIEKQESAIAGQAQLIKEQKSAIEGYEAQIKALTLGLQGHDALTGNAAAPQSSLETLSNKAAAGEAALEEQNSTYEAQIQALTKELQEQKVAYQAALARPPSLEALRQSANGSDGEAASVLGRILEAQIQALTAAHEAELKKNVLEREQALGLLAEYRYYFSARVEKSGDAGYIINARDKDNILLYVNPLYGLRFTKRKAYIYRNNNEYIGIISISGSDGLLRAQVLELVSGKEPEPNDRILLEMTQE